MTATRPPDPPDHADMRVPPPLLYLAAFLVGLALERLLPMPVIPHSVGRPLGAVLVTAWAGLMFWSGDSFRRARTSVLPIRPTTALVTVGPFSFTRNPMYLSLALLYAGLALWLGTVWPLVLLLPLLLLVQRVVIEREERYLERKFGEEYRRYRARVRRWL